MVVADVEEVEAEVEAGLTIFFSRSFCFIKHLQVQEPKGKKPPQEGQEPCQEEKQEQEWGQGRRRRRQEEPFLQEHEQGTQESVAKAQRVSISPDHLFTFSSLMYFFIMFPFASNHFSVQKCTH